MKTLRFLLIVSGLSLAVSARAITSVSLTVPSTAEVGSGYTVSANGSDDFGEINDLTVTRNGSYWASISNDWGEYNFTISLSGSDTAPSSTGSVSYHATLDTSSTSVYDTKSVTITDTTPPSVPSGLGSNSVTMTSFNLTWSASTDNVGVTAYEVMQGSTSLGTTSGTSMSITGLSMNTTYGMSVRAGDAAGNWSSWSSTYNVTTANDTSPPSVPTGLSASSVGLTSFTLSWSASTDNVGVTGYEVMQGSTSLGTTSGTSMNITGLSPNTAYSMQVRARDAAGNWSDWSSVDSVTTAADTTKPSVPTGLSSSSVGLTSFTLSWSASSDNVGVTAYEVKRGTTSLGTTSGTSMSITGLSPNTMYGMSVRAGDAAGNWSDWSSALSVTTQADTTKPSVPTGLASSSVGVTSFTLSWSASTDNVGVTAYIVNENTVDLSPSVSGTSITLTGLTPNTTYTMKVKAGDAAGNWSDLSSSLSVTTAADTSKPSVPTGLASSSVGLTSFTLSWSASTDNVGVTAYVVNENGTDLSPSVSGTSLNLTGLTPNTNYTMKVKAGDAAGNWSDLSSGYSVTTNADTSAPTMPSSPPAGSNRKMTSFTVSWGASTDNVGVTGYEVMRDTTSLGTVSGTSVNVTGLTVGTTYAMKVRARDAAGNWSSWTASTNVSTTALTDDDDGDGLTNGEEITLGTDPETTAGPGTWTLNVNQPNGN